MPPHPENVSTSVAGPPNRAPDTVNSADPVNPPGRSGPTRSAARPLAIWSALAVLYVVWGSTYFAIKAITVYLPPFASAWPRFAVAGLILAVYLLVRHGWRALRISVRELASASLIGVLLLGGGNGFIVLTESPAYRLPSGIAALLVALNPILTVALRATTGDRPRLASIMGVVVGLAGLAILFLPGGGEASFSVFGALLVLLGVASWCGGSFASRYLPMPRDPLVSTTYQMLAGSLILLAASLWRHEPAPWLVGAPAQAWLWLAYLVVVGSLIGFSAYVWLLDHVPISLASTYAYVNPIIAILLGVAFAGEILTTHILLSAGITLAGVALVVSAERRSRSAD